MIDISSVAHGLLDAEEQVVATAGRLIWDELDTVQQQLIASAQSTYLTQMARLSRTGGIPFDYHENLPVSAFHTATVVSNLMDMGLEDHKLTTQLVEWLVNRQQQGWWFSRELQQLEVIPAWHDPTNKATRIMTTAMVAGVLARIDNYDTNVAEALAAINEYSYDNGSLQGFSQATWFVTPAISRVHGLDSAIFLQHWSLLDQMVDQVSLDQQLLICRLLQLSGITKDPLLARVKDRIEQGFDSASNGWQLSGTYHAPTTLLAVQVLQALT